MSEAFRHDPTPQPNKPDVVRVSMPAEYLYNLERFQKIQRDILGRLGCQACTSGLDIRWDFTRNFLVDEKAQIHELGGFVR